MNNKQTPLESLTASAKKLSKTDIRTKKTRTGSEQGSWQDDAWDMFDLVGEQRFLATNLAGQLSKAHLYVGRYDEDSGAPARLGEEQEDGSSTMTAEEKRAEELLQSLGGSNSGRAQILQRLAVNLFITGEGWLAGIPPRNSSEITGDDLGGPDRLQLTQRIGEQYPDAEEEREIVAEDLEWRMLSVSEVSINSSTEKVELQLDQGVKAEYDPDDLYLIRVWRPHPRKWWEADSPTRSSLPVLKELVGLTMHVSAQIDSRLAGAGILALPQSVQRALATQAGIDPDTSGDLFSEGLIEAMLTPIGDRASASAIVPLVITVPGEAVEQIKHISFSQPLDEAAKGLRDEAIRRLALGQDAPPELLLGTGNMNHWGGWLVQSETVETHIAPVLALICDAITTQFLWPALMADGMTEEEAQEYVVWYDVDHLIARPNRGSDAQTLHSVGAITDEALRRYSGFEETDAPEELEEGQENDPALDLVLDMVRRAPTLAAAPGIPELVRQIRAAMADDGTAAPLPDDQEDGGTDDAESDSGGIPGTLDDDAEPEPAPSGG